MFGYLYFILWDLGNNRHFWGTWCQHRSHIWSIRLNSHWKFYDNLKALQEKWDSIEKKNAHAKGNQYSFYERFLHEKSEIIKRTMLPPTRKACGFTTLNDVNEKEYVPKFYTNDIENVNSQIKFWVKKKLPLDVFIQKLKDLIEFQER